jgi:hypothetical protein
MSVGILVTTRSHNGLPLETLIKAVRDNGFELVEHVEYVKCRRSGRVVYEVTMHESVNPDIERDGK